MTSVELDNTLPFVLCLGMPNKPLPKKLYKFRDWNEEYHKRILTDYVLWFASPLSLNDPRDCGIAPRWDKLSEEDKLKYLIMLARSRGDSRNDEQLRRAALIIRKTHPAFDRNNLANTTETYRDTFAEDVGILSFSSIADDTLLWSHYADAHKGFCVEFDTRNLLTSFYDHVRSPNFIYRDYVQYYDDLPDIVPDLGDEDWNTHRRILLTKSSDWRYEKEFRFIYGGSTKLELIFRKKSLTAVYLGCEMCEQHKKEITDIVRTRFPNASLYQAKKKLEEFGLEFDPIDD